MSGKHKARPLSKSFRRWLEQTAADENFEAILSCSDARAILAALERAEDNGLERAAAMVLAEADEVTHRYAARRNAGGGLERDTVTSIAVLRGVAGVIAAMKRGKS